MSTWHYAVAYYYSLFLMMVVFTLYSRLDVCLQWYLGNWIYSSCKTEYTLIVGNSNYLYESNWNDLKIQSFPTLSESVKTMKIKFL